MEIVGFPAQKYHQKLVPAWQYCLGITKPINVFRVTSFYGMFYEIFKISYLIEFFYQLLQSSITSLFLMP